MALSGKTLTSLQPMNRSPVLALAAVQAGISRSFAARPALESVTSRPLQRGDRLGQYDVVELVGAGSMGEVYRARDTKLGRDVALKVLPAGVANDPERLARFRREAHLLAALNHAHIAQVHGFEDTSGVQALVMELVEGPHSRII